jgi:hypothetical protein
VVGISLAWEVPEEVVVVEEEEDSNHYITYLNSNVIIIAR